MATLQYKNHYAGSGKGYVHKAYDDKGAAGALREGEKRGLALATVRNWISTWRNPADASATKKVKNTVAAKKSKPAKKAASAKKSTAKKSIVKKATAKKAKAPAAKKPKAASPKSDTVPARKPREPRAPSATKDVTLNG